MDTSSSDTEDQSTPLLPPSPPTDGDVEDDEDAFEVLSRVTQSPDLVPWEQRSMKMKIVHVADRVFLWFLAIFMLVLFGEVAYMLYHTIPWAAISRQVKDRLLMQEEGEEELDL